VIRKEPAKRTSIVKKPTQKRAELGHTHSANTTKSPGCIAVAATAPGVPGTGEDEEMRNEQIQWLISFRQAGRASAERESGRMDLKG
jgi:hypothetical protein